MEEKAINKALRSTGDVPLWAKELKYQHVFDRIFSAPRKVEDIIGYDNDSVMEIRREANLADEDSARFRCIACDCPLNLLSTSNRSGFYFKHRRHVENCPIKDEKSIPPDILRAKKFDGKQESLPHRYMKSLLYRLLECDPRFVDVDKEKTWWDNEKKERRRPDVQGVFQGDKIVFEIQISTEFLDVIHKRREFYQRNNALLVWVFHDWALEKARISDLDISSSNNHNVIVLDADAFEESRKTGKLHLTCHWRRPVISGNHIEYVPESALCDFAELDRKIEECQIYRYDYENEKRKARQKFFERVWRSGVGLNDDAETAKIIKKCFDYPIIDNSNLARFIHMIWAAQTGERSGWNFPHPFHKQVFHKLFDSYKSLVFIFMSACEVEDYKAKPLPYDEDLIAQKKREIEESFRKASDEQTSPFYPEARFLEVIQKIFPALDQHLSNRLKALTPTSRRTDA